jgi:hypothetical protein
VPRPGDRGPQGSDRPQAGHSCGPAAYARLAGRPADEGLHAWAARPDGGTGRAAAGRTGSSHAFAGAPTRLRA